MSINRLKKIPEDLENFLVESQIPFAERTACLAHLEAIKGEYFQSVHQTGKTNGLAKLAPLGWDSTLFGFPCQRLLPVGRLPEDGNALIAEALRGIEGLVDTKIAVEDSSWLIALQEQGFQLRDTLVTFEVVLEAPASYGYSPSGPEGFHIRRAVQGDEENLRALSGACFSDPKETPSRILTDPRISLTNACRFYGQWGANLVRNKDSVAFVAIDGEELVGFIGLEPGNEPGRLHIPLNGVHPNARGNGIYQALLAHAILYGKGQGYTSLTIGTHLAQPAIAHIWTKIGGKMIRAQYCLHYWAK